MTKNANIRTEFQRQIKKGNTAKNKPKNRLVFKFFLHRVRIAKMSLEKGFLFYLLLRLRGEARG